MLSFDKLVEFLKVLKGFEIIEPIASCPRYANIDCARISGNCDVGNKKECWQIFQFFIDKTLYLVRVGFVYKENSTKGFFDLNNATVKLMLSRKILSDEMLKSFEF